MRRRDQPPALRAAKAVPRELLALLQNPVDIQQRLVRRSGRGRAAPIMLQQVIEPAQIPEEKYYEEEPADFGEIDLGGGPPDPSQLLFANLIRAYEDLDRNPTTAGAQRIADLVSQAEREGLAEASIRQAYQDARAEAEARYPNAMLFMRQHLQGLREAKENEINRRRGRWVRLEQSQGIPRNAWLQQGVRVLNDVGTEYEGESIVSGMPRVLQQLPAINFVDRLVKNKPQIEDWRRCGRCQWEDDDGNQCSRYASCHRDYPSLRYCWQHARADGQHYERRVGLV